ncbi:MAG: hypothetical protein Q9195_002780 [Heterodermia aff. obscurata]
MANAFEAQDGLSSREETSIPDFETSKQFARLDDLKAQATLKYAVKDYDAAVELYSQATELQATINGEMAGENADLLYAYGRYTTSTDQQRVDEEVVTKIVETKEGLGDSVKEFAKEGKPFFQFSGDENFDESEDENQSANEDDQYSEPADEDDDFVNAYEVLDLARILLSKRLEEAQAGKGKVTELSAIAKQLKERLADTHDLQAEISLEGERFPNAVIDLKAALELKEELYPPASSLIAEAHYKLSLALEFSSVTQQKNGSGGVVDGGEATIDEAMREEAAKEMEAAIASCQLRIEYEEASIGSGSASPKSLDKPEITQADIDEVKELVTDMQQRLLELRQPPISINDPTGTGAVDGAKPLSGILGSILGESNTAQKTRIEEASKGAKDLTGLVKRKKASNAPSPQPVAREAPEMNGKRKVAFDENVIEVGTGKKAKLSDNEEE